MNDSTVYMEKDMSFNVQSSIDPLSEHERRLTKRRGEEDRQERIHRRVSQARLTAFLAGIVLLWLALESRAVPIGVPAIAFVAFAGLAAFHFGIAAKLRRSKAATEHHLSAIERLKGRWVGKGDAGERFAILRELEGHPYAADLDLFGKGSVFERVCFAGTAFGRETLANWLTKPAVIDVVRSRQAAVAELRDKIDLREDLAVLARESPSEGIDVAGLIAWGQSPFEKPPIWARLIAPVLAVFAVLSLVAWLGFDRGGIPFAIAVVLNIAFARPFQARTERVLKPVARKADELLVLAATFKRWEQDSFESAPLQSLRGRLGSSAASEIDRLARLVFWVESRRNPMFMAIAPLLLWSTQFAFAVEVRRGRIGPKIADWLEALGELEALASLATFAFENPLDVFPELVAREDGPLFDAEGLGHPFISLQECTRNDVLLDPAHRLWVVSGSNMAGKSTLLRSVGVASVLGLAGGTVRANRLRIAPMTLGATLRVSDSLLDGRSRFLAELNRLKKLVELADTSPPLLFLLDEVFSGTNSSDRRVGAEAVVRALLDRGGFGLITTHDLALTAIVDRLGPLARNVHMLDHFDPDGSLRFDHIVRPGVVPRGNALALMRAVGLELPEIELPAPILEE